MWHRRQFKCDVYSTLGDLIISEKDARGQAARRSYIHTDLLYCAQGVHCDFCEWLVLLKNKDDWPHKDKN